MLGKKRQSTLNRLLDSSIRLLAQDTNTTMAEIAQASGVGRTTLHRYFPSRAALMKELSAMAMKETEVVVDKVWRGNTKLSASKKLLLILEAMIPIADRFHFLHRERMSQYDQQLSDAYQRQRNDFKALICELKQEGFISPEIPNEWAELAIDNLTWAAWQGINEGMIAPRQSAQMVFNTIANGLLWSRQEKPAASDNQQLVD